jgi:hypothetical protein
LREGHSQFLGSYSSELGATLSKKRLLGKNMCFTVLTHLFIMPGTILGAGMLLRTRQKIHEPVELGFLLRKRKKKGSWADRQ